MNEQHQEDRLTHPEPETTPQSVSAHHLLGRGPEMAEADTLPIAHTQVPDPMLRALFAHYQHLEDRLFLAGSLTLVFVLILWAIASA